MKTILISLFLLTFIKLSSQFINLKKGESSLSPGLAMSFIDNNSLFEGSLMFSRPRSNLSIYIGEVSEQTAFGSNLELCLIRQTNRNPIGFSVNGGLINFNSSFSGTIGSLFYLRMLKRKSFKLQTVVGFDKILSQNTDPVFNIGLILTPSDANNYYNFFLSRSAVIGGSPYSDNSAISIGFNIQFKLKQVVKPVKDNIQ